MGWESNKLPLEICPGWLGGSSRRGGKKGVAHFASRKPPSKQRTRIFTGIDDQASDKDWVKQVITNKEVNFNQQKDVVEVSNLFVSRVQLFLFIKLTYDINSVWSQPCS